MDGYYLYNPHGGKIYQRPGATAHVGGFFYQKKSPAGSFFAGWAAQTPPASPRQSSGKATAKPEGSRSLPIEALGPIGC
jgi:hypothetical protein